MSDGQQRTAGDPPSASWRLLQPGDLPFVYELVAHVDPRWWRFSRHGLEPSRLIETAKGIAAGVIVLDEHGRRVACAILAEAASSGTGTLEFFALPDARSVALATQFAPELISAAFVGAPIRRLYHERFENDTDLLGEMSALFEVEVTYPEFAMIDGRYESRFVSVMTAERFGAWLPQEPQ